MKTVYELHKFWTSTSAIFGFTSLTGRMSKILTPGIHIELIEKMFNLPPYKMSSFQTFLKECELLLFQIAKYLN